MNKKTFFRHRQVAVTLAVCLLFTGCGGSRNQTVMLYDKENEDKDGQVDITLFGYKADALNLTAIETAIDGFTKENPNIHIIYEGLKGSTYWGAFDKRVNADVMDDIIMIDHDHVQTLSAEGKLVDLRNVPGLDRFNDQAASQFTDKDGAVYFLPTCISTYGLYINYDLLEAHGQTIPENFDDFARVCDYFVSRGIVPVIANNYASMRTLIAAKGMFPIYQREDSAALIQQYNETPQALAEVLKPGIELVAEMIEKGWMDAEEVLHTEQTSDDLQLFVQGTRPFMITGGWASPRVAAMEPDFRFGIHPYPILEDGSVLITDVNTCVAVNADGPYIKEALDFIAYIVRPDVMWEYCDSQSSYAPIVDERIPSDEAIVPCVEYLTNGRSVIGSDYRLEMSLDAGLKECGAALLKGAGAEEAEALLKTFLKNDDKPGDN